MQDRPLRFPLERRRETWSDPWHPSAPYAPFARREGDLVRMKLQHWMDLAHAALADDRQDGSKHEDDQIAEP